jgi:hypothetical protein
VAQLVADEVAERAAGSVSRRVIGQRTACITISRISGDAVRMRTRSPAAGTSDGSNSTEIVVTAACRVAWCVHPAGIHAAWCGGSRYVPSDVSTSTAPWTAYSIWWRSWW